MKKRTSMATRRKEREATLINELSVLVDDELNAIVRARHFGSLAIEATPDHKMAEFVCRQDAAKQVLANRQAKVDEFLGEKQPKSLNALTIALSNVSEEWFKARALQKYCSTATAREQPAIGKVNEQPSGGNKRNSNAEQERPKRQTRQLQNLPIEEIGRIASSSVGDYTLEEICVAKNLNYQVEQLRTMDISELCDVEKQRDKLRWAISLVKKISTERKGEMTTENDRRLRASREHKHPKDDMDDFWSRPRWV